MSQQRFEGPTLEAVLADVRSRFGPDAGIVEANRLRRGGFAGFFARQRYEVVVDTESPGGHPQPPAPGVDHVPSTESPDFSTVLDSLIRQAGAEDGLELSPAPAPDPQPAATADVAAVAALVRVGLPEELVATPAGGGDPARWIATLLEGAPRPAPLPRTRGTVVAAIGSRIPALALARALAGDLRIDPAEVVLASSGYRGRAVPGHRRISSLEAAGDLRRSWRRRSHPTVVAIEAPPGRDANWARQVLDVLEPAMTWASVEAIRKPEDVAAWSECLGGLDALAVTGLEETESPAAVLRCGIPVGRLDGRPATPSLWGALLAERLAS